MYVYSCPYLRQWISIWNCRDAKSQKIQILAQCCFNYYQLSIAWHIKRQLRHVRLLVLSNVKNSPKKSNVFSLLSDKTKKCSNSSQLRSRNQWMFNFVLEKLPTSTPSPLYKRLWVVHRKVVTKSRVYHGCSLMYAWREVKVGKFSTNLVLCDIRLW